MKLFNRNTLADILIILPMLLLIISAFSKFFESGNAVNMFAAWGILEHMRWISISEFIIAILVIIPKTYKLGILLLSIFMSGAVSVHLLSFQENFMFVPIIILVSPIIGYMIKNKFEFFKNLFS
jgi:uncharacterized membrane protein YphA (DoxX/SURF4 family)